MIEPAIPLIWISVLFLAIALTYAAVGLGGGSSYAALLVLFGFSSLTIPNLSLVLNLIATSIGSYHYIRRGHLDRRLIAPFLLLSLPMAWLGGSLQVDETLFQGLLLASLLVVLVRIYGWRQTAFEFRLSRLQTTLIALVSGAVMGLLSGIVGIGGGIFLVPLILLLGMGSIQQAAACGAVFIWLNSLAGLLSRWQYNFVDLTDYWPLILAVAAGSAAGSLFGSSTISPRILEKILGAVILVAVILLGRSLAGF